MAFAVVKDDIVVYDDSSSIEEIHITLDNNDEVSLGDIGTSNLDDTGVEIN